MEEENYNTDAEMAYYSDEEDEVEAMQKRLKELEEETAALRQATKPLVGQSAAGDQDQAAIASECDARSIFIGNVDYGCTPEEVQQHFESCGEVNRVTIRTDKLGQPMGFAYVEFVERGGAEKALAEFDESELHGRQIKVVAKRTNVPGMKQFRGRRFSRGRGGGRGGGRGYSPYGGYGKAAPRRFKRPAPQRFNYF